MTEGCLQTFCSQLRAQPQPYLLSIPPTKPQPLPFITCVHCSPRTVCAILCGQVGHVRLHCWVSGKCI